MISHKTGFHQNINQLDAASIEQEVKRLLKSNADDNKVRFNEELHVRQTKSNFPPEKAEKILEHAYQPHSGQVLKSPKTVTAADLERDKRKKTKKAMRSRRR